SNGGWLPPGLFPSGVGVTTPAPTPTPNPAASSRSGCSTPDPFVVMGGGTCSNGGWYPPGMLVSSTNGVSAPTPTPTPTPTPAPSLASAVTSASTSSGAGCATPDPFTVMGGGTCFNGGWFPPGMIVDQSSAPAPTP